MAKSSLVVLYNEPLLARDHPDAESEHSVVVIAEGIARILGEAGFRVSLLPLGSDPTVLWRAMKKGKPDAVVNLFEGHIDNPETESYVAGLLDWLGIPYTGCPFATLSLARAKHTAKYLLKGAGLPTAAFQVVDALPMPECTLEYPVIVKPARQDGSVGLDHASVCVNPFQLEERVHYILATYGAPVLIEEFIEGREFQIPVVELPDLRPLPISEVYFPNTAPGAWSILTYDGKWNPDSPDYDKSTTSAFPTDLTRATSRKLERLALKAFQLLGCRDYARVDFRMSEEGKLYILEVNPNPEISPISGFAEFQGIGPSSYGEFLVKLAEQAVSRRHAPKPTFAPVRSGVETPGAPASVPPSA